MKRLTAAEARQMAGPTVDGKVDALLVFVASEAKLGKRKVSTGHDYHGDEDLWINGGYSQTEDWKKAKAILEELGYTVIFYYKEGQFVDMYTVIEW